MTYFHAETHNTEDLLMLGPVAASYQRAEAVATLADLNPSVIYFEYTKPVAFKYYSMEIDDLGVLCVTYQHPDERRLQDFAEANPDVIFFALEV